MSQSTTRTADGNAGSNRRFKQLLEREEEKTGRGEKCYRTQTRWWKSAVTFIPRNSLCSRFGVLQMMLV